MGDYHSAGQGKWKFNRKSDLSSMRVSSRIQQEGNPHKHGMGGSKKKKKRKSTGTEKRVSAFKNLQIMLRMARILTMESLGVEGMGTVSKTKIALRAEVTTGDG